jgi:hypothetical protein
MRFRMIGKRSKERHGPPQADHLHKQLKGGPLEADHDEFFESEE